MSNDTEASPPEQEAEQEIDSLGSEVDAKVADEIAEDDLLGGLE